MNIGGEENTLYTRERRISNSQLLSGLGNSRTSLWRDLLAFQRPAYDPPLPCMLESVFLQISFFKHGYEKTKEDTVSL